MSGRSQEVDHNTDEISKNLQRKHDYCIKLVRQALLLGLKKHKKQLRAKRNHHHQHQCSFFQK